MAKNRSPAYQRYPRDILANPDIVALNYEEYGVYERLRDYIWLEESLPNDERYLANILKIRLNKFQKIFSSIKKLFKIENGKITCPDLDEERQKQAAWRLKSSEGGKETVRRRREKVKGGSQMVQRVVEPKLNSSTSTSTSTSTTNPPPPKNENSNGNGGGKKNGVGEMGFSKFSEEERRKYAKSQTGIKDVNAYVNSLGSKRGDFDGRIEKWMADHCPNCRAYNSDRLSGDPRLPPCPKHGDENFDQWKSRIVERKKSKCRDCRSHLEYPDESPECEKHTEERFNLWIEENLKIRGLDPAQYFTVEAKSAVAEANIEFSAN
jgi:uncharacterized protein YdaU (DUF1376 family)